jgi:DnaJ-class molecular chaperone
MSESFYNILGVGETSSKEEIKKSYRTLSLKWHPDRNPNNIEEAVSKIQKINEAYETLSDDQKRSEYDNMNKNPFMRMNSHGGGGGMEMPFQDMNEIFSNLFGGGNPFGQFNMRGVPPGAKIHVFHGGQQMGFIPGFQKPTPIIKHININMEQVLNGATIPVDIERWLIENNNKIFEHETLYISIPKGIDDNEIILIRDKGNILNDDIKGDVKLFIKIENTTGFERKGLDLLINKSISLKEALCGFTFELKYINGKTYTLNNISGNIIPPNYIKVIPNMGLTREAHTGNLLITFQVEFPEKLSDEKMNALKEIL